MGKSKYLSLWPGYDGPKTPGPLHVVAWPDTHPDTHCDEHGYTPDEHGQCTGCKWVPAETICCEKCNEPLRLKMEMSFIEQVIAESGFHPEELTLAAYQAYCDEFEDKLEGRPDLKDVTAWFKGLTREQQREVARKYLRRNGLVVGVVINSADLDPDGDGFFTSLEDRLFEEAIDLAPEDILQALIDNPETPEKAKKYIRKRLEKSVKAEEKTDTPA